MGGQKTQEGGSIFETKLDVCSNREAKHEMGRTDFKCGGLGTTVPHPLATNLKAVNKNFPKHKDFTRTEQHYIGRTAVKVSMTDTHLDLLIAN